MHKVVHICYSDFAGVGKKLSDAINKYCPDWKSTHIALTTNKFQYSHDILVNKGNMKLTKQVINEADVIQFHSSYEVDEIRGFKIPRNKIRAIYHVGSNYRLAMGGYRNKLNKNMDIIFAGESLMKFNKKSIYLPSPIDTDRFLPIEKDKRKVIIAHSPSSRSRKGTKYFEHAMRILTSEYPKVEMLLLENITHDEVMRRLANTNIFFDNIGNSYSMYGQSSVQAACFGIPVLVGKSNCIYKNPLIHVTIDNLTEKLRDMIEDRRARNKKGTLTRRWVVRTHGEKNITEKVIKTYEGKM